MFSKKQIRRFKNPQKISKHLMCPICQEVFRRPSLLRCGHTFCKHCIATWRINHKQCPSCRDKIEHSFQLIPNYIPQQFINELAIGCADEQCGWEGKYEDLKAHYQTCKFILQTNDKDMNVEKAITIEEDMKTTEEINVSDDNADENEDEDEYIQQIIQVSKGSKGSSSLEEDEDGGDKSSSELQILGTKRRKNSSKDTLRRKNKIKHWNRIMKHSNQFVESFENYQKGQQSFTLERVDRDKPLNHIHLKPVNKKDTQTSSSSSQQESEDLFIQGGYHNHLKFSPKKQPSANIFNQGEGVVSKMSPKNLRKKEKTSKQVTISVDEDDNDCEYGQSHFTQKPYKQIHLETLNIDEQSETQDKPKGEDQLNKKGLNGGDLSHKASTEDIYLDSQQVNGKAESIITCFSSVIPLTKQNNDQEPFEIENEERKINPIINILFGSME